MTTEEQESPSFAVNGAKMRERRKLLGYSLAAFAKLTGITEGFVGHLERGRRRAGPAVFGRICDALDIPVENRKELVAPDEPAAR